ncbi:hypothetical protein EKK58_10055 [Candidatus Dependentiae bacterium]|nr:MAG: hypothetical protein EKK58_10055 [Candidatus Dependentiae bacterium]
MEQANFPLEIQQGVSFLIPFYYFDENGLPIDLTDCTARMQARATVNSEDPPILDWSTEDGQISINASAGCVLVAATPADTEALEQTAEAVYDLLLTFPTGFVANLVSGPISIIGRVTR